jgi:hypothetical protein
VVVDDEQDQDAAGTITSPSPAATAISHRSALAMNANLLEQNRRLARQVSDLQHRLPELLGQQAFDRSASAHPPTPASTVSLSDGDSTGHRQRRRGPLASFRPPPTAGAK